MTENKYYILDFGEYMTYYANYMKAKLEKDSNNHVMLYLTNQEYEMTLTEVTEVEYLQHYGSLN